MDAMNALVDTVTDLELETGLWGTLEVWSRALGIPVWKLRERLAAYPSRLSWVHEEEFDYVTDSFAELHVLQACSDLLAHPTAA
jgi:hypothetical protein